MTRSYLNKRGASRISELTADFQHRAEPNFAWARACSTILALPGLRAFWPCSSMYHTAADRLRDVSGNGNHLTEIAESGNALFGYYSTSLEPWLWLVAQNQQSFQRADGGVANWADITGTEAYVTPACQGLTIGGWFRATNADTGSGQFLMSKYNWTGNQRSYYLALDGTGHLSFETSADGTAGGSLVTTTTVGTASDDTWFFGVGRYCNSANRQYVTLNIETVEGVKNTNIWDSTAPFELGTVANRYGYWYDGLYSMLFLCAQCLDESKVQAVFEVTRPMYNVTI